MIVDLPEPVEPTRKTNSPGWTANVASSRPRSPLGYFFETERKSITAPGTGSPTTRWRGGAGSGRSRRRLMWRSVAAMVDQQGIRPARRLPSLQAELRQRYRLWAWPRSTPPPSPTGFPLYRVDLPGTRAVTVLVAFEAGARTERPEENGMAHFLEHLVFKGGEKYDDYRKVNETAERMGAVLNAYTSHDLVAFHITCRAEVVGDAIDLLTDFVGRPKIDQEELDRERGVVIQEIARANDQPSRRGRAPDRPRRVRRPPARAPRARPRGAPAHVQPRRDPRLPRGASGPARAAARSSSATSSTSRRTRSWPRRSAASRRSRPTAATSPRPAFEPADAGRAARLQPVAPAHLLPPVDRPARPARTARRWPSTARCWAARWARGCSTRSASSAASPTRSTPSTTRSPTCRSCSSPPGWSRASAARPTRGCARSSTSCAPTGRARRRSSAPARTPPAAGCSRSRTRTRSRAMRRRRPSSTARRSTPTRAIALLDEVTFDQVAEVARGISEDASVACVGPHELAEFA